MIKNKNVTRKMAEFLISLGETHANKFSTLLGFYEPKISSDIIKKEK